MGGKSRSKGHAENYIDWSERIREDLKAEGVWMCVERGYKKPKGGGEMSDTEMERLKQEMVNDARALSLIRHSLPPPILVHILDAPSAKQAWDTLHHIFQDHSKLIEEVEDESGGGESVMPLSGDKPFFDMILVKSALKPLCHMNFPNRVDSLLPSTNILAKVRFSEQIYEIYFYGRRAQKSFGAGWRQVLDDHHFMEGDFLVFEILESSDTKVEMNMQILRTPEFPPQLQQKIEKRRLHPKSSRNNRT